MTMECDHPAVEVLVTFVIGAVAGLCTPAGAAWLQPEAAFALFDLGHDGIGAIEGMATAWLFGQAAVLFRHVLSGIARG